VFSKEEEEYAKLSLWTIPAKFDSN